MNVTKTPFKLILYADAAIVTAIALMLLQTMMALAAGPNDYERVYWDKKDALKVISKATAFDGDAFGKKFLRMGGGPKTYGLWLTDDVCWALSVIAAEEERLTPDEQQDIYKDCRSHAADHYTIYVSAQYKQVYSLGGVTTWDIHADSVDGKRVKQIFLQQRKNKNKFVRPTSIEEPADYFVHLEYTGVLRSLIGSYDIDHDVIIRFPRDEKLLEGQKDIDLELRQGGNKQRLKFSLKKLRSNKGRLANL